MATGKMSFNYYQNGKYGSLPHNPQKDMEVTQDMHLKMSKKIAQLTKVIYALNTKNDESEGVIQVLREQHEEEKQSLLADFQAKMQLYRTKLEGEKDHHQKISILQARISDYEQQQTSVEGRLAHIKEEAQAREQQLQESYSRQVQQLMQDALRAKREFEECLEGFEAWKNQVEKKHMAEIQDAEEKHAREVENLRSFQRNQDTEWLNQSTVIKEKYSSQIAELQEKLEASHAEKLKMEEDFNEKLAKAQAFYEQELKANQQNHTSTFEGELSVLRTQQEKLKNDFLAQERELRKQIERLVRQLADAEDLAETFKQEKEKIMRELQSKESGAETMIKQLQQVLQEKEAAQAQLRDVERDLVASKERCSDQAADLLKKSALIGEFEAYKVQRSAQVEELTKHLEHLKQELSRLEADRDTMKSYQATFTTEQQSQLDFLKQRIEELSVEREVLKQRHERELNNIKQNSEDQLRELQTSLEDKLSAALRQHLEERERDKKTAEDLLRAKQELEARFLEEQTRLTDEKNAIQAEFERVKADLLVRCKQAEDEVARLSVLVAESENGLGAASTHIGILKDAASTVKAELDRTRTELKSAKLHSASLQAERDNLQSQYNSKMAEWQLELRSRLETLAADLDAKWTETMRSECSKLRHEVSAQKDDERRAALEHLSHLKDQELEADRAGFESRLAQLNRQVSDLHLKLELAQSSVENERSKLQGALEVETARLEAELLKVRGDHERKIQQLEMDHQNLLLKTVQQKDVEREEGEKVLKAGHMEDMQAQLSAHRAAMAAAQEEAEQLLKARLREVEDTHRFQKEKLQSDLAEQQEEAVQKLQKAHASVLHAARMELERAVEVSKQKERDHQMQVEELKEEISQRETHIIKLKDEIKRLQGTIKSLDATIMEKERSAERAQLEAKEHLRQVEVRLHQDHMWALDNQAADHTRENEAMVVQFNHAQEILKDKISELQILLSEAEERYRQRESRPDDLELIHQLRLEVQERELRVKQLIDEKRFYQLELVNRETNFNKVFSSTPNVGVLNPLVVKSKKKGADGTPAKFLSAPSLGAPSRLDPLPGSPLHDSILNPTKPLPQPAFTKKFVK